MGIVESQDAASPLDDMDASHSIALDIQALLTNFTLEIISHDVETAADLASLIPAGTQVYLPFLPHSTFAHCVNAAERLAREGFVPVLHIAARRLTETSELADVLVRLHETAGLHSALVIGGDVNEPAGPYASSMELLETGLLETHGISEIGIAGYPEGHPAIAEAVIRDELARKCDYAKSSTANFKIVSQFTFSPQAVLRWESELKAAGHTLPVLLSVPGPAKLTTLLKYAKKCGVSASMRQLTQNRKALMGLVTTSTPDHLLTEIARYRAMSPDSLIAGIHFNTFGGYEETAWWVRAILNGNFAMNGGSAGFSVERD